MNKEVEILAPCGTIESFYAAINAGADAVYLGGDMFGARAFAGNFNEEQLIEALHYAHLCHKKIYLTVNTLLRDDEIDKLYGFLKPFYEEGLDAAIVQDLGVFSEIKRNFPDMDIHASTQMTVTGSYGASLLKDLGASRIVTAREMSLKEIKEIHDNVDIEIETFVHGALCYSYSGQCLLSSMIGGRSGNRGRCAQPCRLEFSCGDIKNKHLLSPKDLCTVTEISGLIESGVYSMKIEGRMKNPTYTACVVDTYRRYVDMYLEKGREGFKVNEKDLKNLCDIYNRGGFTKSYLFMKNDRDMMTFDRPNHQGLKVGSFSKGKLFACEDLSGGDVIELPNGNEIELSVGCKSGGSINIKTDNKSDNKTDLKGDVYRTKNKKLIDEINNTFCGSIKKCPLSIKASIKVGEPIMLTVSSSNEEVTVTGDAIEESLNRPATLEDVSTRLKKLGNTNYYCDDIDVKLDGNAFIPIKSLNELRREAIEKLEEKILYKYKRTAKEYENISVSEIQKLPQGELTVQIMTDNQLNAVCSSEYYDRIDRICISTEIMGIDEAIILGHQLMTGSKKVYLCLPYIFRPAVRDTFIKKWDDISSAFDGFVVRNLEEMEVLRRYNMLDKVMLDYDMYTYNSKAYSFFVNLGVKEVRLPEELNEKQLLRLHGEKSLYRELACEKLVYGKLPLMVSAGCTFSYTKGKAVCGKPGFYNITDRKGKNMKSLNCCHYCYNLLYNSVPTFLLDKLGDLRRLNSGAYIMFSDENENTVKDVLTTYFEVKDDISDISMPNDSYTRGHYNRGVE